MYNNEDNEKDVFNGNPAFKEEWQNNLPPEHFINEMQSNERSLRREMISMITSIVIIIAMIPLLLWVRTTKAVGASMQPIMYTGDMGIIIKKPMKYKQNDIIVFVKEDDIEKTQVVKMLVGKEGDVITYEGGLMFLNGEPKPEYSDLSQRMLDKKRIEIGKDQFYMVGAHTEGGHSYDSRIHGVITRKEIVGKFYPTKEKEINEMIKKRKKNYEHKINGELDLIDREVDEFNNSQIEGELIYDPENKPVTPPANSTVLTPEQIEELSK